MGKLRSCHGLHKRFSTCSIGIDGKTKFKAKVCFGLETTSSGYSFMQCLIVYLRFIHHSLVVVRNSAAQTWFGQGFLLDGSRSTPFFLELLSRMAAQMILMLCPRKKGLVCFCSQGITTLSLWLKKHNEIYCHFFAPGLLYLSVRQGLNMQTDINETVY